MKKPRGKRLRAITEATPPAAWTLPADLVLEIVLRTDAATIVRSAACCKPLRRDILSPDFVRRFGLMPAACLLGFLRAYDQKLPAPRPSALFSLLHPTTPAAASLSETRIVPLLSSGAAADLLGSYVPVTSRHGLLVLRRRHTKSRGRKDMCVFDPFTGDIAFVPHPPVVKRDSGYIYVLLTAADGVGSSFLLVAADFVKRGRSRFIKIRTVSSAAAHRKQPWGRVTMATNPLPPEFPLFPCCAAVVLSSTLIHWLMYGWDKGSLILTYRVGATAAGTIELPAGALPDECSPLHLHLTSSPDGRLKLLVSDQFTVSIWLLLSRGDDGWERQASIDISPLLPDMTQRCPEPGRVMIDFVGSSAGGRSGAVLLWPFTVEDSRVILVDMETKEMRWINRTNGIRSAFLYEVDLSSRLSAMKSF